MVMSSPSPGAFIAIAVVLFIVQASAVAARFWSRSLADQVSYGTDDFFVLAASIAYTGLLTIPIIIGAAGAGLGQHIKIGPNREPIPPSHLFDRIQFVLLLFHVIVLGLARCSILFLYRRIFVGRTFKIVVWTLIAYTAAWTIGFFFTFLFKCSPISATVATFPPRTAKCVNLQVVTRALGVTSVLSDVMLLIVPLPLVYKLHMGRARKVAVGFIFLLGNLTIAASIVRCVVLFQIDHELDKGIVDLPYYDGVNIVWTLLEATVAIVCSCLPALSRYMLRGLPAGLRSFVSRVRRALSSHGYHTRVSDSAGSNDRKAGGIELVKSGQSGDTRDSKKHISAEVTSPRQVGPQHDVEIVEESV